MVEILQCCEPKRTAIVLFENRMMYHSYYCYVGKINPYFEFENTTINMSNWTALMFCQCNHKSELATIVNDSVDSIFYNIHAPLPYKMFKNHRYLQTILVGSRSL